MNCLSRNFFTYIRNIDNYSFVCKKERECFQHGNTTVLKHSRNVAYGSLVVAKKLEEKFNIKFDYRALIEGAFLHDFFMYDWHKKEPGHKLHGFTHARTASKNAIEICNADNNVACIIKTHMWPLTLTKIPRSREAFIVCMVDKYMAVIETFKKYNKGVKTENEIYNSKNNTEQVLKLMKT